ncbi:hypothetical protein Acid345_3779 [Candidatus Koribacter versatilis Ellin345]|uniref:Uncharacterized protein n=1 Tax=Koribacter versatilis (strain Ellin345) TaxID=204669 RepID=Q1IK21_KORVE|nr:hypothetical protein [Candidatus Koribacter versatilis]ABF42779.1 hypothetical protein Acid345_3779 [Candidatus Koribacter versatilis Ellin345]
MISCRLAACPENLGDGESWSFYLINDGSESIDGGVLEAVEWEWGDIPKSKLMSVAIPDLPSGGHIRIWRDDGEIRVTIKIRLRSAGQESWLEFEFPKLYIQRNLKIIAGLGKIGWQA